MTREEYREEELRDALHEHRMYNDFDYAYDSLITQERREALDIVKKLVEEIQKYHEFVGFDELAEMV